MAFWIATIPNVFNMLPAKPIQKSFGENYSTSNFSGLCWFQNTIAATKTIQFTQKYAENDNVEASKPLVMIKCLDSIPFVLNPIGVIIPNMTGIHAGTE